MSIGGFTQAVLQVKDTCAYNALGERVHKWVDVACVAGWLDLSNGESKWTSFQAKVQESTHFFLCDYTSLKNLSAKWLWNPLNLISSVINTESGSELVSVTTDNSHMVVDGNVYEILLIDDPMGMHHHLEFYLRFVGVQNA